MDEYTKIDLHIHSSASGKTKSGDRKITENSNIDNIEILVNKLIENEINMCAITDHNIFDKDLYLKLKEYENKSCLKKVLPGVELDVEINNKVVHVVLIFDDTIQGHEDRLSKNFDGKETTFTLSELAHKLANVDLNFISIVHQRADVKNEKAKTSLSSAGVETCRYMISIDYFDCLEIQSTKVEGILRSRFCDDNFKPQPLVFGTDCHDWKCYPYHDSSKNTDNVVNFSYIKALPSFRGLSMAATNHLRFRKYKFDNGREYLTEIQLKHNDEIIKIPLSYGINVIIGDNSVGKTSLLKVLFNCGLETDLKTMKDYFKKNKIEVTSSGKGVEKYEFVKQGGIAEKFKDDKDPIKDEFTGMYDQINVQLYKEHVINIFELFGKQWKHNKQISDINSALNVDLVIPSENLGDNYYPIFDNDGLGNSKKYYGITHNLNNINEDICSLIERFNNVLENEDCEKFNNIVSFLENTKQKYFYKELNEEFNNKIRSSIKSINTKVNNEFGKKRTADESRKVDVLNSYNNQIDNLAKKRLLEQKSKIIDRSKFENIKLDERKSDVADYIFISKVSSFKEITIDLIEKFILKYIDFKSIDEIYTSTSDYVINNIKTKTVNKEVAQSVDNLVKLLSTDFNDQYLNETLEIKKNGDDLVFGNSVGTNSLYYLDLKTKVFNKPIFIIDQPEDDVAQSKINSVLIDSLRNLAIKAQVIFVTHNPQLVVNLDADNVIIMKKRKDGICFNYGPLELKDDSINILKYVADTLDGGVDVIRQRWKIYDKNY